jgi:hypothetical protein
MASLNVIKNLRSGPFDLPAPLRPLTATVAIAKTIGSENEYFLCATGLLGLRRHFDAGTEGVRAHAAECREPANRWHEESKRRYEELTRQWL